MLVGYSTAAIAPLLAIFSTSLVVPVGSAPTPSTLNIDYFNPGALVIKDILHPTYLIPVTELEPYHAFGPVNASSIYKYPGVEMDIAMEVAFTVPKTISNSSYFGVGFSSKFQDPEWLQSIWGSHKFAIYAFAADSCSISPTDTWSNHTAIDRVGGLVYQVIANSTGVYMNGDVFAYVNARQALNRLHHSCDGDMRIEFWMEAWGEEFCEFGWVQDKYDGIYLGVFELDSTTFV